MTLSLKQRAEEIVELVTDCMNCSTPHYAKFKGKCSEAKHIEQALQEVREETIQECAEIADSRRDKEYNAGKFNASVGKHDWVIQYHNGAAFSASEISQEIIALLPPPKTGKP